MAAIRGALLALGVVIGGYGGWLLWDRSDTDGLINTGIWLAGGVVLHDFVLAGVLIIVSLLAARFLPTAARGPAGVAMVVFGSLSLVAFPMIAGFGANAGNPSLLDRPYTASWLVLAAVTAVLVVAASVRRARSVTDRPLEAKDSGRG